METALPSTVLILPGIRNSGPQHWQSLWENTNPDFVRVHQRDWNNPVCEAWATALESTVKRSGPQVVLVAHSIACLVVAHWAAKPHTPIDAALLVAVPNPNSPNFPAEAVGFANTPSQPFPFKSTVVVSNDDPYGSPEHAGQLARAWGSHVVNIGNRGHINADSGLGAWPEGYELLNQLRALPEMKRT